MGGYLADAVDQVPEEEARGTDEELLPFRPFRQPYSEQGPSLLLPSLPHSSLSFSTLLPLSPPMDLEEEGDGEGKGTRGSPPQNAREISKSKMLGGDYKGRRVERRGRLRRYQSNYSNKDRHDNSNRKT